MKPVYRSSRVGREQPSSAAERVDAAPAPLMSRTSWWWRHWGSCCCSRGGPAELLARRMTDETRRRRVACWQNTTTTTTHPQRQQHGSRRDGTTTYGGRTAQEQNTGLFLLDLPYLTSSFTGSRAASIKRPLLLSVDSTCLCRQLWCWISRKLSHLIVRV